ncbi:unnamed protein product [Musa hybrid cultivar]
MAMVLDAFVNIFIEKLADLIQDRVVMMLEVDDELQKLKESLETIICLLKVAKRKKIQDSAIGSWVSKLKDVMYEADDIIDLCKAEGGVLAEEEPSSASLGQRVRRCFPLLSFFVGVPFRYQIGIKIRDLNDRLQHLSNDNLSFSKLASINRQASISAITSKTSPLVPPDITGSVIYKATDNLIGLLNKGNERSCRLFAITGMGGIGKTTLAQKIFNDSRIIDNYEIRLWVCVSKVYSEIDLLKQMIRGAEIDYGQAKERAELEPMLRRAIDGKSVFLVLDDIWRADVWVNLLRTPLSSATAIRRILVTTRDGKIANQMGAVHIHTVKLLREGEGWELLCTSASLQRKKDILNLRDIGIGIVRKCHGLPLAIKTMGGVLMTKEKSRGEWEKVLDNGAWTMSKLPKELNGALYLSYEDLPSHLKQCFLYFALFPEDHEFHQEDIVRLWVAEEYIEKEGGRLPEETAEEYYTEFIRRSILQPNPGLGNIKTTKVHDLLRSLARYLAEDECSNVNAREIKFPTKQKLRRLSITEEGNVAIIPGVFSKHNCLRTLMLFRSPTTVLNESLVRLRCLRCLSLRGTATGSIPNSIGNLIHLRYLDLCSTSVSRLPESIGQLTNLQVLDLRSCKHLCTLPRGITRLCNLRCLDLLKAPLEHLPAGIMKLKQLNFLSGFVIGERGNVGNQMLSVCDLEELRSLDRLRHLGLDRLERYSSNGTSLLLNKSLLQILRLSCTSAVERQYSEEETNQIQHVLDNLKPPPGLDDLIIVGFFGRKNPSWMQSSSLVTCFPCLTCLTLKNFASCLQLPPLGELPHLQYLKIIGANSVLSIGPEFLGDDAATSTAFFPELKSLIIAKMPNWEEWSLHRGGGEAEEEIAAAPERPRLLLPNLETFILRNCPKLRSLPQGLLDHATKLRSLCIEGANELKAVENLPSLSGLLQTKDCPSLERISNLGALRKLEIIGCPSLVCVEKVDVLKRLQMSDAAMERLPEWLSGLVQQPNSSLVVVVVCDVRLLERCIRGGEDWHIVQQIPAVSLHADTDRGSRYVHYKKEPVSYETNFSTES